MEKKQLASSQHLDFPQIFSTASRVVGLLHDRWSAESSALRRQAVQKELKAVQLVGSSKSIGDEQVGR